MATEQHKADNTEHNPVLYASEQTAEKLGWIGTKIIEISNIDTLVITRDDIISMNGSSQSSSLIDSSANPYDLVNWQKTSENLSTVFAQSGLPPNYFTNLDLLQLSESIIFENASALGLDFNEDGIHDFGIITAPDLDASPEEYIGGLAGISSNKLMNIPGDTEDYVAFIMFHESDHLTQSADITGDYATLPLEISADQTGIQEYQDSIREGQDLDPAVLETIRDARIVGSAGESGTVFGMLGDMLGLNNYGEAPGHTTGFLLNIDNGLPQMNAEAALEDTHNASMANLAVNITLGARALTEISESFHSTGEISEEDIYNRYGLNQMDMIEAMSGSPIKLAELGAAYGAMNPGASYATLQGLHEKEYMKNYHGSDAYVRKVENFYAKHVDGIENEPAYSDMKSFLDRVIDDANEEPNTQTLDTQELDTTLTPIIPAPTSPTHS